MKFKKILGFATCLAAASIALASCTQDNGKQKEKDWIENYESNSEIVNSTPSATGKTYYVSPNASLEGTGTKEDPMVFDFALLEVKAGDQILLSGGTYNYSYRLEPGKGPAQGTYSTTGEPGKYIIIRPETDNDRVIFDFSQMSFDGANRGIQVYSDYWYFYGIEVCGAGDNGMYISGNHNIVENCMFYNNADTGLQLGRGYSAETHISQWPSFNLIKNCTSFANYDGPTFGENADGFAAKLTVGYGNIFDGCIAYRNSDDGWDMYAKQDSGNIGTVTLYNCVSFENGYLPYPIEKENADGSKVMTYNTIAGDGIGFKLGGSIMEGDVVLKNCLAFDNKLHGFGDNSNPGFIEITNCTAVNNCAGIDEFGNISGRGLKDETNKSNNFDLARTIASYNSYSGLVSYISNQKDYIPVGDSEYNTDMFRGSIEYSILNTSYEDGKEVYKAFGEYADGSWYHSDKEDVAYKAGYKYDGMSADMFADISSINAKCNTVNDLKDLLYIHTNYRNADGSVNMGDKFRITSDKLLTFKNGDPIGHNLTKKTMASYDHPEYNAYLNSPELTPEQATVLSAAIVAAPLTRASATLQSFDVPKFIKGVEVNWSSSNTDVISIDSSESVSASNSVFSNAKVHVPSETTVVTLTAVLTYKNVKVTRNYDVTVLSRNQELGDLVCSTSQALRVNLNGVYNAPQIHAYDSSAISATLLPDDFFTLHYSYEFAKDGNSTFYPIDDVYTSVPGVYRVTVTAIKETDDSITSTYVYNVYIVDPDCSIDFINQESSIALTRDGFNVYGSLSNVEGYVYAVVSDTPLTLTPEQVYNHEDRQSFHIVTDYVTATFNADNSVLKTVPNSGSDIIQYYGYYIVSNANGTNLADARVYNFDVKVVEIDTAEKFHKLARTGSPDGSTYPSTTIFSLTTDLDFSTETWTITNKDQSAPFKGLFNGNGHLISNLIIKDVENDVNDKIYNVFYSVQDGTIMNLRLDNMEFSTEKGSLSAFIGELRGGYVHNIKMTNIAARANTAAAALVGQVSGGINFISQCQLINPVPEEGKEQEFIDAGKYIISTVNKYAGGIVGNMQKNSDQSFVELTVTDCSVIANIGDGKDAGGCCGGIIGRSKNEFETYNLNVKNCYYKGTIIAKGNYNGGIVGSFENGAGHVKIYDCIGLTRFIYKGELFDAYKTFLEVGTDDKSLHKNYNPIVGRAVGTKDSDYQTDGNYGTFGEYYSQFIISSSIVFELSYQDEETYEIKWYTFAEGLIESMGFDLENIWNFNEEAQTLTLK